MQKEMQKTAAEEREQILNIIPRLTIHAVWQEREDPGADSNPPLAASASRPPPANR